MVILVWLQAIPQILAVIILPLLGFGFYSEACPKCGASLALQGDKGFVAIRSPCSACGHDL